MDKSVVLKDQALRIYYTLESIQKWVKKLPHIKIIICDGSNFDFSPLIKKAFPESNIECLFFMNDAEKIEEFGKGYGEGEIIKHALKHSNYLMESDSFVKCTAKLWVNNFEKIIGHWNNAFLCRPYFSKVFSFTPCRLEYIDTRFYVVSKYFYEDFFLDAHKKINASKGIGIENIFLDVVKEANLKNIFLSIPPIIAGVGGGSGRYYNVSKIRCLKEKYRTYFTSSNLKYSHLFQK